MSGRSPRAARWLAGPLCTAFFLLLAGCGGDQAPEAKAPFRSAQDLHGKKIGVLLGSTQDLYATKNFPGSSIVRFNTLTDETNALQAKQIEASIDDVAAVAPVLKKNPDLSTFGDVLMVEDMGVGFRKEDPALRGEFNAFLSEIRKSGLLEEIRRRWVDGQDAAVMPALPAPGTGDPLVLGTSDLGLPFTALKEGKYVGYDIELMERFARRLNRPLEIRSMQFASLLAALESGKVDVLASCITITEERKKQIDFSDVYFQSSTIAVTTKDRLTTQPAAAAEGSKPFLKGLADDFYDNIIREDRYMLIVDGLWTTVVISVFSALFGTLLGAGICFMRMHRNPLLSYPARFFISILRGTPLLVLLMIMFYIVFASMDVDPVLASILTFGLNFAAYVSEMFRVAVESVDPGQVEAGIALGFTRFGTFRHIVLPQATRRVLPVYKGEFISMIKMTSVVGYIAVQDLTKASDIIRSRTFDAFFPLIMVAVLYFAITYLLTFCLTILEKRLDRKGRRKRAAAA